MDRARLLGMTRRELDELLERGHSFDARALDDTEYRGLSLGLPRWIERLAWKKFKKVFHRDRESGALRGWNMRIEQNALDEPWIPMTRGGKPITFGHFIVRGEPDVFLDYGFMRDPLVSLADGDAELLLGVSDIAIGPLRLRTPTYFCLERAGARGSPAAC